MLKERFESLLDAIKVDYEQLLPSEWAEKNLKLTSEISTVKGAFRYKNTPYTREIVDHFSPYSPAKVIAIMKGSQSGLSQGLVINGICWMIANNPGNLLFTSAGDDLSKEMIEMRLDQAIRSAKIDHLIRPNVIKKRNQRTGDTSKYKEYAGGRAFFGGTNATDKLSRQRSLMYGIFDDWDAAKRIDKDQGDLFTLLQKRFSTAKNVMKQFYISTPETRPSNIEIVYNMGDKRKWFIPCPKCGTYIELVWSGEKDGEKYGVVFEKDEEGRLIPESVGYVCQECMQRFEEKEKYKMNLHGIWKPTCKPEREGYVSYQMSNLIAAPFMMGWKDFANEWLSIHKNGVVSQSKLKVFMNQTLGLPWEQQQEKIQSTKLAKNTRGYKIGMVPNQKSKDDGNGSIVMLTCAADLHGLEDDGRLDYEVVGHSASGAWYSITHGSIGTFYSGSKDQTREKVSAVNGVQDGIWERFYDEVINIDYPTDDDNSRRIMTTAVDTGHLARKVYRFINDHPGEVVGVKGKVYAQGTYKKISSDTRIFKPSQEVPNNYILEVDVIKDTLAEMISLKKTKPQQPGFMNFPIPENNLYTVRGYFQQYEAEERVVDQSDDGEVLGWKWVNKKNRANHFFDIAVYNLALRDIFSFELCRRLKIKEGGWDYFCTIMEDYVD